MRSPVDLHFENLCIHPL